MKQKVLFIVLMLILSKIISLPLAAEAGGKYRAFNYVGWLRNESYEIRVSKEDPSTGWLVFGNDGYHIAQFCEPLSEFECFFSKRLAFAVPKDGINTASWILRDHEFKVIEKNLSITLLGTQIDGLYLIESPAEATLAGLHTQKSTFWLYSTKIGVVGFGADAIPDNRSTVYWLRGNIGFGKSTGKVREK